MSASWVCSALLTAALLTGCGGGADLDSTDLAPGKGMRDVPDRRTSGSATTVPTWEAGGGDVSFSLLVINRGSETVEVTAVARDEDGDDQQFVPEGIAEPVTLEPRVGRRVEIHGRAECGNRMAGQVSRKNGQRFVLRGGETVDTDFPAIIEFVCSR